MSDDRNSTQLIDRDSSRRNARRTALLVVLIAVAAAGVGLAVSMLRSDHHGHRHSPLAAVLIVVAVLAVVLAITIPLTLRLYRRPDYARVLQYSWGQRRRVSRALRKGQPISPADRPVADAIVDMMRRQRWPPVLFAAVLLIYLAQALFDHGFQRWFAIALVVLYAVLLPWIFWQRRTTLANYARLGPSPTGTGSIK